MKLAAPIALALLLVLVPSALAQGGKTRPRPPKGISGTFERPARGGGSGPAPTPAPEVPQEPAKDQGDADAAAVYVPPNSPLDLDVVVSSGELRVRLTDLFVRGRGPLGFAVELFYRSRLVSDGPFGPGWSFAYGERLYLQPRGDVVRADGRGHVDSWTPDGAGGYVAPAGWFMTLKRYPDGSFVLRETDGLKHRYDPAGRLTALEDRHGSALTFAYDARGNLTEVRDVYGRRYELEYAQHGGRDRVVTVRDFAGREVLYGYDAEGHLVSVRSPVVVGTSTGNDFPNGRTTQMGYVDGRLAWIRRPQEVVDAGPAAFSVVYGSAGLAAGRVVSAILGGTNASGIPAGGTLGLDYAAGSGTAQLEVTVTERNGNQREVDVDSQQHRIAERVLTRGLRPGEPTHFETTWTFDVDGQVLVETRPLGNRIETIRGTGRRELQGLPVEVRSVPDPMRGGSPIVWTYTHEGLYGQLVVVTDPRGNDTTAYVDYQEGTAPIPDAVEFGIPVALARGLGDMNGDGNTGQVAGDVVREETTVTLDPASARASLLGTTTETIVVEIQHNDAGQPVRAIDGEGNATNYSYYPENDPDGDGTLVPGQSSTAPTGQLSAETVDAELTARRRTTTTPAALETLYAYDPCGERTSERNARGVVTSYEVTALGEVVVETRGDDVSHAVATGQLVTGESAFRDRWEYDRNANGDLVETRVPNLRTGNPAEPTELTTRWTYDILGAGRVQREAVGTADERVTTYTYGQDGHLTRVSRGGIDDGLTRDERNDPHLWTRGEGTPEAATVEYAYDDNGNLAQVRDADDTDGVGGPEVTSYAYDGHDRLSRVTQEQREDVLERDPAGNVTRRLVRGQSPDPGTSTFVDLSDTAYVYDERHRRTTEDPSVFLPAGSSPQGAVALPASARRTYEYDAEDRLTREMDGDGRTVDYHYDGAGRVERFLDGLGNQDVFSYDAAGNRIRHDRTVVASKGSVPDEARTRYLAYDQFGDRVRTTDPLGRSLSYQYDSRGNLRSTMDAVSGTLQSDPYGQIPGLINTPGNLEKYAYDPLGRRTRVERHLTTTGQGGDPLDVTASNPNGIGTVSYAYDERGRLTGVTDDNGGGTTYVYDALGNRVEERDGLNRSTFFSWDRDGNLQETSRPTGDVIATTNRSDGLPVEERVTAFGAATAGAAVQTFDYDGRGLLASATVGDAVGTVLASTERTWDSRGELVEEVSDGEATTVELTGAGRRVATTYPSGDVLSVGLDAKGRPDQLSHSAAGPLVDGIEYLGAGNQDLEVTFASGAVRTHLDAAGTNAGIDAAGQETWFRVVEFGGITAIERTTEYDGAGFRTLERRVDRGDEDITTYNSDHSVRRELLEQGAPFQANFVTDMTNTYDGARNWVQRDWVSFFGPTTYTLTSNASNTPDLFSGFSVQSDASGRITDDSLAQYVYDAWGRVLQYAALDITVDYAYDAEGRLVEKRSYETFSGTVRKHFRFAYLGDDIVQLLDLRSGTPSVLAEFFYAQGSDGGPIAVRFDGTQVYFSVWDAARSMVARLGAFGAIQQKLLYDAYAGVSWFYDAVGVPAYVLHPGSFHDECAQVLLPGNDGSYWSTAFDRLNQPANVESLLGTGNAYGDGRPLVGAPHEVSPLPDEELDVDSSFLPLFVQEAAPPEVLRRLRKSVQDASSGGPLRFPNGDPIPEAAVPGVHRGFFERFQSVSAEKPEPGPFYIDPASIPREPAFPKPALPELSLGVDRRFDPDPLDVFLFTFLHFRG